LEALIFTAEGESIEKRARRGRGWAYIQNTRILLVAEYHI
jgi:hypothetical protein